MSDSPRTDHDAPQPRSYLDGPAAVAQLARAYLQALLHGDRQAAARLVLDAAEQGTPVKDLYLHLFQPVQREIGRLWQINRVSVAQEHYCTAATQLIMSQLYPSVFSSEKIGRTLVLTCVAGELHELGARMVADFFEMDGWDTFFSGANTPADEVVRILVEREADLLGISVTIDWHVEAAGRLIAAVRERPECAALHILVGGNAFNAAPDLWQRLGADGTAADAQAAIETAVQLVDGSAAGS